MKILLISLLSLTALFGFSRDKIAPPFGLNFGDPMTQFQKILTAQSFKDGSPSPMPINQIDDFRKNFNLQQEFTYNLCPRIGTMKTGLLTGYFTSADKLALVRVSFTYENTYYDVKRILITKYGAPKTEDSLIQSNQGGAMRASIWNVNGDKIRLYVNAAEPMAGPYLEYMDMTILNVAEKEKNKLDVKSL